METAFFDGLSFGLKRTSSGIGFEPRLFGFGFAPRLFGFGFGFEEELGCDELGRTALDVLGPRNLNASGYLTGGGPAMGSCS